MSLIQSEEDASPQLTNCSHCGWEALVGPHGGYVCNQCFHTEEPPVRAKAGG